MDDWWKSDPIAEDTQAEQDGDWWKSDPVAEEKPKASPGGLGGDSTRSRPGVSRETSLLDETDNARANRGFGRSAYGSDGSLDHLRPDTGAPAVSPKVEQRPERQEEPDPFKGESFTDLATRRGQQAAAGATDVFASIPEAIAIRQTISEKGISKDASGYILRAIETLEQIQARREANPNMSAEDTERLADVARQSLATIKNYYPISLGSVLEQEISPAKDRAIFQKGDDLREYSQEVFGAPDPRDKSFWGKLAYGGGNMAGFMAASFAGAPAGPAGILASGAIAGSSLNSSALYKEALEYGASEEEALAAARLGALVGASEIVPIGTIFKFIPTKYRQKVANALVQRLFAAGAGAGEEGIQEALAGIANNMIAQGIYDPERGTFENVGEEALIGSILGGGMGLASGGNSQDTRPDSPRLTPDDRRSPLPNDVIDDGKRLINEALGDEPPSTPQAQPAPGAPRTPPEGMVPQGAVPVNELYGAPEAQEQPQAPTGATQEPQGGLGPSQPTTEAPTAAPPASEQVEETNDQTREVPPVSATARENLEDEEGNPAPQSENMVEGSTPRGIEVLSNSDLESVETDAETFQYKGGGDQEGVTDRLRGVKQWDNNRTGIGLVYEYEDGRRVIVDGHQRFGLAKRLSDEGQEVELPVRILREADGVTEADARAIGAEKNIAEGTGSALDAAKVFRDTGKSAKQMNLPMSSGMVRTADDLASLSDEAFGMVNNEVASERDGAIVGRLVEDQSKHSDILGLLARLKPANVTQAESIVRQASEATVTETQDSLFGEEEVSANLYLERAKILDRAMKDLGRDTQTFKTLVDRGETITSAGNVLKEEANAERLDEASQLRATLSKQANTKGPVSDALTEAARALKDGAKIGAAARQFIEAASNPQEVAGTGGAQAGPVGRSDEPAQTESQPDQTRVDQTPEGEQLVVPGAEKIGDRELAERQMDKPKQGGNSAPPEGGLFDEGARAQTDMFDAPEAQRADADQSRTDQETGPWVVREKETGASVMETTDRKKVDALNTEKYEAVPTGQHLQDLNNPETKAYKHARRDKVDAKSDGKGKGAKKDRSTLEDFAGEGREHVYAEYGGQRYFVSSHRNQDAAKAAITALQYGDMRKPSYYITDRADDTSINGDRRDLEKVLKEEAQARADKGTLFDPYATQPDAPATKGKSDKIEDFGEVLHGAQKHKANEWAKRASAVLDDDISSVPLSKSWPEPNYQELIDEGVDPWVVGFIRAARDEIPRKPRGWKLKGWSQQVQALRGLATNLIEGNHDRARLEEMLNEEERGLQGISGRVDLYMAVGHEKSLQGFTLKQSEYTVFEGKTYSPAAPYKRWEVAEPAKKAVMSYWPKIHATADTKDGAIEAFKAIYPTLETGPKKGRKGTPKFIIYSRRDARDLGWIVGKKIGKHHADLKTGFEDSRQARLWMAENEAELVRLLEKFKDTPSERKAENDPRVGDDHRNGTDVTPDQFSETFGFRGVQFGNYVEGPRRQEDLNNAYDGLMDLAAVLGIPPKAISLNGSLGLAFGARGKGGKGAAAAHYEPDTVVINLTKKQGAGSLAHEWWHGLDNYFSMARNDGLNYLSERPYERGDGVRPEVVAAFKEVMTTLNQTRLKERSKNLDNRRSKPYWGTGREMSARSFEAYVIAKLADESKSNDYLANILPKEVWEALDGPGTYPYLEESEIPAVREAFDALFNTIETKETDQGVAMFSVRRDTLNRDLDPRYSVVNEVAGVAGELRPEFTAEASKIEKDLRARADALGLQKVDVGVLGRLLGRLADGTTTEVDGVFLDRAILLALDGSQPIEETFNHEVIHALRNMDAFKSAEWKTLERAAKADTAAMEDARTAYRGAPEEIIVEEVIANMYRDYAAGRLTPKGFIRDALARIKRMIEALGNVLRGNGFQTAESVFAKVESGQVGRRTERLSDVMKDGRISFSTEMPVFFSPLLRFVEGAKEAKAQAKDWVAILSKAPGVKKSELEWTGTLDWLETQEGQITREDLAGFIRGNQVEVVSEWLVEGLDAEYSIEVGEAVEPDEEFIRENAEDIYFDDLYQEAVDRLDEDETEADIDREEVMAAAIETAEMAYYEDAREYHATLAPHNWAGDAEPIIYEGYYNAEDEAYWFPDLAKEMPELDDLSEYDAVDAAQNLANTRNNNGREIVGDAQFETYTEDGGENYSELLLRVPQLHESGKNNPVSVRDRKEYQRLLTEMKRLEDEHGSRVRWDKSDEGKKWTEISQRARAMLRYDNNQEKIPFSESAHFDRENIVVHARLKDRTGPNGEKILFVEEIQSDLASKWRDNSESEEVTARRRELLKASKDARKEASELWAETVAKIETPSGDKLSAGNLGFGYELALAVTRENYVLEGIFDTRTMNELIEVVQGSPELMAAMKHLNDLRDRHKKAHDDLLALGTEKSIDPSLPDTPFRDPATYALMVKRLLREAADGGYDALAWTPGYMQAERWDNAAQSVVDSVKWEPAPESTGAAKRVVLGLEGSENVALVSEAGVVSGAPPINGKPLSQVLGPQIAKQIMEDPAGEVSGQKITFGDSGYAIAYDQNIRKAVDKAVRKHGSKVYVDKTVPDFGYNPPTVRSVLPTVSSEQMLEWWQNQGQRGADVLAEIESRIEADIERFVSIQKDNIENLEKTLTNETDLSGPYRDQLENALLERKANLTRVPVLQENSRKKLMADYMGHKRMLEVFGDSVETAETLGNPVWRVDLTPELKEAAKRPQPMFSVRRFAVDETTGIEERKETMLKAIASQPLDQAIRIPFHLVGGLNEKGEWKPGLRIAEAMKRTITEKKFDETGPFGFLAHPIEVARAGLIDRYGLPQDYVERERTRGLEERSILAEGQEHLEALLSNRVSRQEAEVLQSILTEGATVSDEAMMNLAEPIRNAIDSLGQEAVQIGLISQESYERNKGSYLHRVYMKHEGDQSGVAKFASQFAARRRHKIVGDAFKGRGLFETVTLDNLMSETPAFREGATGVPDDGTKFRMLDLVKEPAQGDMLNGEARSTTVKRVFIPADQPVPGTLADYKDRGVWEVRGKMGKNEIVLWRDFSKKERRRMGEIMDARYTIAKTYMHMAHDLATGRFFQDIAENEEWARSMPPDGATWKDSSEYKRFWNDPNVQWVRVPEALISKSKTKRWGALAGKYVRAEIWRDLIELDKLNSSNTWRAALTQFKLNKTARSPVVHMNNVMSNFMLMDMADVRMSDLRRGVVAMMRKDKNYQDALEHGAFGSDMVAQEMRRNTLDPILKEIAKDMQGDVDGMENRIGVMSRVLSSTYNGVKKIDNAMISAYQMEDEIFRMATYMRRRQQGASPKAAAIEARDQFLNYDIRAPWVNAARASVLPFLSYTYRAVPIVAKTIMTRPWKVAKYMAVAHGMQALAYALAESDWSEEEERKSLREQEQGSTWLGTPRLMRLPSLDAAGNPVFLDVRRWIPAGDVFDMSQGNAVGPVPAWMQPGGPLMLAAELVLNRSSFTGQDIVNPMTDSGSDKAVKVGEYLWRSWMPSAAWIPNSWYWNKINNARKGAREWGTNRRYSMGQAISSSVGIKVKPQDVEVGYLSWQLEFGRIERELNFESRKLRRDRERGLISEKQFHAGMESLMDKMDRLSRKRNDTFPR